MYKFIVQCPHKKYFKSMGVLQYNAKKSSIHESVYIDLSADITMGDYSEIGYGVRIYTHKHYWNHSRGLRKDIQYIKKFNLIIGKDVYIGTNTIIIGIEKIGDGAVIGAGSIVTKNVDPYTVVAGNPAKVINTRKESV